MGFYCEKESALYDDEIIKLEFLYVMQNATDKISGIYEGVKILDSIKFNKKFKVYGSDEFEMRFLISYSFMDRILNLEKRKKFLLLYLTIITFIFL